MGTLRKITFEEWIEDIGPSNLAELLGVNKTTITHWRAGRVYPRIDLMRKIKQLSKGVIGYEEIIDRPLRLTVRKVGRQ